MIKERNIQYEHIIFTVSPMQHLQTRPKMAGWPRNLLWSPPYQREQNPTAAELETWYKKSGLPLKKFFNTSGNLYKEQNLKDRLPEMTEAEQLELLSTDGMLVKRPIVVGEDFVLVGFKDVEFEDKLK